MRNFTKIIAALLMLSLGLLLIKNDSSQILPWLDDEQYFIYPYSYQPFQYFYFNPQYKNIYPNNPFYRPWIKAPIENRGEEYRKWLKCSVRIRNGNVSGSGTICYYDRDKKTAWVISCGHLFSGGEKTCEIHAFYKNETKLEAPVKYTATILCWTPPISDGGDDIAFMTFQPDWDVDEYFPIAKEDHPVTPGETYYSCGCDGAREVACYLMKCIGMEGRNLVLTENAPRHGRSGGGLMTKDGYYIGICWGSTDPYNGTGKGLFVPLNKIHPYAKKNNLEWLLNVSGGSNVEARRLPIINWTGEKRLFPPDYIPIP